MVFDHGEWGSYLQNLDTLLNYEIWLGHFLNSALLLGQSQVINFGNW